MKIGLIGYGKMGRRIEEVALARGHEVVARCDREPWDLEGIADAEICFEFSNPTSALPNIEKLARMGKNLVVGTTGWYGSLPQVEEIVQRHQIGLLYSPNFSLGIQILKAIVAYSARLLDRFEEYDGAGVEYHHRTKEDAPSGTALALARLVEAEMGRIEKFPFSSVRCGAFPGEHSLLFDSPYDTITLSHKARSREGFALGAVRAGEWLWGKRGVYTFEDYIAEQAT